MKITSILELNIEHEDLHQRNNIWFVKLRWYAVITLLVFVFTLEFASPISLTPLQFISFIIVTILIAVYNLFFHKRNKSEKKKINSAQKESLIQILLDLFFLSILVYFSGGIEAPIFLFYVFHMIIGSIILPKKVMYSIAALLIIFMSLFTFLEYYNLITHQTIIGFYPFAIYKSAQFIIGFLTVFSFIMIISIYLTSRIVGEIYNRENQLKRALKEVDEAEISKQKYMMAVVHELKSPISASMANLDLVLGNYVGEVNSTALEKLSRSKEKLSESINSINNILRFSQFRLLNKLEKANINLNTLIKDLIDKQKQIADRKNIQINFQPSNEINYYGDDLLLKIAFSNLIGNSIKYTLEKGKVLIELQEEENVIMISISDNGIGIPDSDLPNIFEEYFRASNVKTIEGTGTGLSTIKRVIESHNGRIKVKSPSKIGNLIHRGTQFRIILPKN